MHPSTDLRRKQWLLLVGVFSIVAILNYLPALKGRIPFPAQMVTGFPPWESVPGRMDFIEHSADYGDFATLFYPWRYFQGSALSNGELPLWNPHILSGSPFLGNTESALFYPINAVFYAFPLAFAWTLKHILNVILAGTFTALFVRSIGGSLAGAIASGVVFAMAGNMTTWQSSMIIDAAIWLPLICLAVYRLCYAKPDASGFALTVIAFSLPALSGHPETAAQITLVGIAYAFCQSISAGRGVREASYRVSIFAAAGLVSIGICSIQILPTLEWLGRLNHTLDLNWGILKTREALSFFSRDITTNPNSSGLLVPENAAYAGCLTLLLAPAALLHRNKTNALFFLLLIVVALQIVFGGPVHRLIDLTPVLSGLKNWRFILIIDFSLAVLLGLGISVLTQPGVIQGLARAHIWVTTTLCFGCVFFGVWLLGASRYSQVHWLHNRRATLAFLVIGYCLTIGRTFNWLRPRAFSMAAVALISIDMLTYAHGYVPFVSQREIYPEAPVMTFLKNHSDSQARIVNLDATYGSNAEMVYGLNAVGGWDLSLNLLKRFLEGVGEPSLDDLHFGTSRVAAATDRRLDLLNAKFFVTNSYGESYATLAKQPDRFSQIFSEGTVQVFENRRVLPKAFVVPASTRGIEVIEDDEAQLRRVKDPMFDPEQTVVLPKMAEGLDLLADGPSGVASEVEWAAPTPNRVELKVRTSHPGVLVLSQVFYPGWEVFVDDVQRPVLRVNYALTGVALANGATSVKFVYNPASYRIGRAVSLASIAGLLVVLVYWKRKEIRETSNTSPGI